MTSVFAGPHSVHPARPTRCRRTGREAIGPDQCVLTTGAYTLDDIAMHLGVLDIEFTVLEPAELRSRVEAIADRFHRAAQREAETTVPSERRGVRPALGKGSEDPS